MSQERHKEELEHIQAQMNAKTDESLESTRRMVQIAQESQDIGIKTLTMLDNQGEQLNNIESGLKHINEDMKAAEKNLEDLEKCCGLCVLPWRRRKRYKKYSDYASTGKDHDDGKISIDARTLAVADRDQLPQGGFITRITNDAREDEMESNLADVSTLVGNLKTMATTMGNELDKQNGQLVRIIDQAEMTDGRIQKAVKVADRKLKK